MKYTKNERLDIGRQVVTHELTKKEAMAKYNLVRSSVEKYMMLYEESVGIQSKHRMVLPATSSTLADIDAYMAMSKEELINELIKAKANELRAKKGYEVKGVGANKEFITLNSRNTK